MIKVPATGAGAPAIEELTARGVNAFCDSYRDLLACIESRREHSVDHSARLVERR